MNTFPASHPSNDSVRKFRSCVARLLVLFALWVEICTFYYVVRKRESIPEFNIDFVRTVRNLWSVCYRIMLVRCFGFCMGSLSMNIKSIPSLHVNFWNEVRCREFYRSRVAKTHLAKLALIHTDKIRPKYVKIIQIIQKKWVSLNFMFTVALQGRNSI